MYLLVISNESFIIRAAKESHLQCQGRYEQVHVLLQRIPFSLTLYSLLLIGLDVVLGIRWLEQLGPVVCNWKQ